MKTKNSTGLINQKKADQIRKLYADKVPVVDIARKYEDDRWASSATVVGKRQ